jgi:hypothetical protein
VSPPRFRGDGAAKERERDGAYQRALRSVQRYAADLERLAVGGHVLPSIAEDLLADAEALMTDIQGQ